MSSEFLDFSVQFALVLLSAAFLITVFKVIMGPTLPDRILALDMLVAAAIGFIAVIGLKTGYTLYVDIAIALGLVGFLATVSFARFILARGQTEEGRERQRNETNQQPKDVLTKGAETDRPAPINKKASKNKAANKKSPARKSTKSSQTRSTKPETKS